MLDPALQDSHALVDLDEEAGRVHHELAHDHFIDDLPPDGFIGPVEHLEQVAAADDPDQPAPRRAPGAA